MYLSYVKNARRLIQSLLRHRQRIEEPVTFASFRYRTKFYAEFGFCYLLHGEVEEQAVANGCRFPVNT